MNLYICDMANVAHLQKEANITQTLSILDYNPLPHYYPFYNGKHTVIKVDDVEIRRDDNSPSLLTVERIIAFATNLKEDDNVLIHCHAGISRSTAAAMIVAYVHCRDFKKVKEIIETIRPQAAPNRLICELADQYFKHDDLFLFDIADDFCQRRFAGQRYVDNKILNGWDEIR